MEKSHELHYTPQNIALTGVKDVLEFSDREIVLTLENISLRITGADLKIKEVDLEVGTLKALGRIITLSYGGGGKEGLLKKLFK